MLTLSPYLRDPRDLHAPHHGEPADVRSNAVYSDPNDVWQSTPSNDTQVRESQTTSTGARPLWYCAGNAGLLALLTLASADAAQSTGTGQNAIPYVMLLALICSMPLCFHVSYRGRGTLLLIFLAFYFYSFAFGDITAIFLGQPAAHRDELFSGGELAILLGALTFSAGYLVAQRLCPPAPAGMFKRDWRAGSIMAMAWLCWLAGTYATIVILFGLGTRLIGAFMGFVVMGRMLGLLGVMLMAYLCFKQRPPNAQAPSRQTALLSLGIILITDFILGFLADSKEAAFRAQVLTALTYLLVRGRVPVLGLGMAVLLAGLTFSTFAAYRNYLSVGNLSRTEALEHLDADFSGIADEESSVSERFRKGLEYMSSRSNLKGAVEVIVARTGVDVPFQGGATFESLAYVLIPRVLIPDKPDTLTGRLFNHEFGFSESQLVYISNTMLGEFYWNYGWTGLIAGMLLTGALLGTLNVLVNLEVHTNPARVIMLMMTLYIVVLRFEDNVAQAYTLWIRTILLLALVHAVMPKERGAIVP